MNNFSTCTDTFEFAKLKLFDVICKNLPDNKNHTQNILECKDDMIFAWNATNCSVLCINWKTIQCDFENASKYQTLLSSSPLNYNVESITASHEGLFLALSGAHGVTILELPRKWGKKGLYNDGKEQIICRSYNLDENLFANNTTIEVLQVRWHPASPKDCQLLVLMSNNSIRVYEENTLRHVWRTGKMPVNVPSTGSNLPYLNSLGDTAVDFDFAPPRVIPSTNMVASSTSLILQNNIQNVSKNENTTKGDKVEWPLIILRGDGSLYVLLIGIDTEKPHLQGPITMYPSVKDNYGVESCSVLVLPSNPPTIVIAESNGNLHHALLLESELNEEISILSTSSFTIYPCEFEIYVLETVKLELGLIENNNNNNDDSRNDTNSCSIHLKRDLVYECRYFAYHDTGLHAISINYMNELQNFVDTTIIDDLPSLSNKSNAEYIVCTRALNSNKLNPILGFILLQSPSGLVLLLKSGQVVSLNIITDPTILQDLNRIKSAQRICTNSGNNDVKNSSLKQIYSEPFEIIIKNILTPNVSNPILKLDKSSEPTSPETYELIFSTTQILREQYFLRHLEAHQKIIKHIKMLQLLKEQQQVAINDLTVEKNKIRENAERLAEMYEDISDKQNMLYKRVQETIRLASLHLPQSASAENEFSEQIMKISEKTKSLAYNMVQLRKKLQDQENQIMQSDAKNKARTIMLHPRHEKVIQDIIAEMTSEIQGQIVELKRINTIIN